MNQTMIVKGENVFQIPSNSFGVAPSSGAYTLNYSADSVNFTAWSEQTPASENLMVINTVPGMFYKLVGNNDDLTVRF